MNQIKIIRNNIKIEVILIAISMSTYIELISMCIESISNLDIREYDGRLKVKMMKILIQYKK